MGKILSLGTKLKYPITISKLLKRPGDAITKQEPILQFKFTWMKEVGDPFGEQWEEKQTTIGDWDSPADGSIKTWKVHEGMVIAKDIPFVEIDETCPHSIQFQGLCGMCGKDMTEMSWASSSNDTERAKVNMIHDQTSLKISEDEAARSGEELQRRLLKNRKLSLVVDLDQTVIHACIEPTVGEWQKDPTSPNYEAVKDVKSFQLNDDGPRGLASGCWYYIKMRPGLKEFLNKISEMYELHIYTMGTRAYAMNIAKIVDPTKKIFGDRIISRDENGSMIQKNLRRLFWDSRMVAIIDDRADVWPQDRPNLIKVVPYDFFLGIGDINSSFLPKLEGPPKIAPALKRKHSAKHDAEEVEPEKVETPDGEKVKDESTNEVKPTADTPASNGGNPVVAKEELIRSGGSDDQALKLEQAADEQEKFLEKQLIERPLLHMQEELDKEDEEEEATTHELKNGDSTQPHPHHRHNLLKDDDVELMYLEKHLSQLHKAFYDDYDRALVSAHGGRVAQLKPGHNKKVSLKSESADLKIVPDVGQVMPKIKAKTLAGCTIVMSGLVPLQAQIMRYFNEILIQELHDLMLEHLTEDRINKKRRTEIGIQADSFGAKIQTKVNRHVTHLVASTSRTRTHKVRQAAKYPHIKIVNQQWLINSMSKWEKEPEEPYLVQIHESDRVRDEGFHSSAPSSINDSDESSDDSESENEEVSSVPASQEEEAIDEEGVMPDDIEEGHSPVDDLKEFDWGEVDDELKEFLGSDSENDSDASDASDSSRVSRGSMRSITSRGGKRKHEDITDDDDSDEESTLAKKQRIANNRTTGLKTVKTPNSVLSESSLPTPGVTGDEEGDDMDLNPIGDDEDDDDGFEDDLEADLMAEFAKEELETQAGDGTG